MADVGEVELPPGDEPTTDFNTNSQGPSGRTSSITESSDVRDPQEGKSNVSDIFHHSEDSENVENVSPPSDTPTTIPSEQSAAPDEASTTQITTPSEQSAALDEASATPITTPSEQSAALDEASTTQITTPSEHSVAPDDEARTTPSEQSAARDGASTTQSITIPSEQSPKSDRQSTGKQTSLPTIRYLEEMKIRENLDVRQSSLDIPNRGTRFVEVQVELGASSSDQTVVPQSTVHYKTAKDLRAEYILITLKNRSRSFVSTRSTLPARLPSRNPNRQAGQAGIVSSASTSRMDTWTIAYTDPEPGQMVPETSDSLEYTNEENVISEESGHQGNETSQTTFICDLPYLFTCGSFLKLGTVLWYRVFFSFFNNNVLSHCLSRLLQALDILQKYFLITCLAMSICAILLWQCPHEIMARTRYLIVTGFIASTSATISCGIHLANLTRPKISWITAECLSSLFMFVMMVIAVSLFIDRFCHLEKQAVMATAIYGCSGCLFLAADFFYLLVQRITYDQNHPHCTRCCCRRASEPED